MIRSLLVLTALVLAAVACGTSEARRSRPTATATRQVRPHHHHSRKAAHGRQRPSSQRQGGPAGCTVQRRTVRVPISRRRWPDLAQHDRLAERTHPRILHLDRPDAARHRLESLAGIATAPGMDRDEYPPAESREGGTGADVRLVPSSENRSEGAVRGNLLHPYCDTQKFRLVVVP